jgi:hypothetical protein
MRSLDFTSWQTLLSTLLGLAVITLIGVGMAEDDEHHGR